MKKKHPSPSARMLLQKMYESQGQGVKEGALADAMHEYTEQIAGLATPATVLVKNLGGTTVNFIEPGEMGVVRPGEEKGARKYLKRVVVAGGEA